MAEDLICKFYSENVVARLNPPHKREDPKLTPSERARLLTSFNRVWHFLSLLHSSKESTKAALEKLSTRDVWYTTATITFLTECLSKCEVGELDRLHSGVNEVPFDGGEAVWEELRVLVRLCHEQFRKRGFYGWTAPPEAPLGVWGMCDQWQGYVEGQFDGYEQGCERDGGDGKA